MEGLIMTAQLLLALTILVGLHEWGHFFTARLFKIKVEKFYLFFDFLFPFSNVLNFALWKYKSGETEYGLGWFPLGGYVKIAGMIDESMDKEFLQNPVQPWEFRAKPAWQRLVVMLGGIIMNMVTGILVFIGLAYWVGKTEVPISEVNKYGIYAYELAEKIGFRTGDKVIAINNKPVEVFSELYQPEYLMEAGTVYTVERQGVRQNIVIPPGFANAIAQQGNKGNFLDILAPFEVGEVLPESNAEMAGLQEKDKIIAIDTFPIRYFQECKQILGRCKNGTVTLRVVRNTDTLFLSSKVTANGTIGFRPHLLIQETKKFYSLAEAIPIGVKEAFGVMFLQIKGFQKIFSGEVSASNSISGPIGMAKFFGGHWNWIKFWTILGMLSMVLAFMNLIPIPALDGGHALILCYEIITGKAPSPKVLQVLQGIGMTILLALMIFAFSNDIYKLF
ncbi:MAG: RIP metalloprotease RseP [Cytophagales bacterium]|nr:RIP metalloprotease RseP [Cytophagales bacterium]MDW8384452.1 RIP metalloprotease RseP [Flammeovirgaceae bacterium]